MSRTTRPGTEPGDRGVSLGRGWAWPAVMTFVALASIYLPDHTGRATGVGVIAAFGGLYAVAMSLAARRLVTAWALRRGGWTGRVNLLGRPGGVPLGREPHAGWRLAAIAGSGVASLAIAVAAALTAQLAAPASYGHAISTFVAAANLALAMSALVPLPGLAGWALLLALADLRGARESTRVGTAAAMARGLVVAIALGGTAVALAGDRLLAIPLLLSLVAIAWVATGATHAMDVQSRFLARYSAAELTHARPEVCQRDDLLSDLPERARREAALVVDPRGNVLGVIGPRQHRAGVRRGAATRCFEAMVGIDHLEVVSGSVPATALVPHLARLGFAVVHVGGHVGIVDAHDLGRQIRVWRLADGIDRTWTGNATDAASDR